MEELGGIVRLSFRPSVRPKYIGSLSTNVREWLSSGVRAVKGRLPPTEEGWVVVRMSLVLRSRAYVLSSVPAPRGTPWKWLRVSHE